MWGRIWLRRGHDRTCRGQHEHGRTRNRTDPHGFGQRSELARGKRARDHAAADGANHGPLLGMDVHSRMESFAAFAAPRLTERTGDLERPVHRLERPEQRLAREGFRVESRSNLRRHGWPYLDLRGRSDEPDERVALVGDDESSAADHRKPRQAAKAGVVACAISEPWT